MHIQLTHTERNNKPRCIMCHDALDTSKDHARCSCGALYHDDCAPETCGTIGCGNHIVIDGGLGECDIDELREELRVELRLIMEKRRREKYLGAAPPIAQDSKNKALQSWHDAEVALIEEQERIRATEIKIFFIVICIATALFCISQAF